MMASSRIISSAAFTLSGTSQASTAFSSQTRQVRVATSSQPAYVKIADGTPTATASDVLIPANWAEYFTVTPGQKAAVLQAGTAGGLSIAEMG